MMRRHPCLSPPVYAQVTVCVAPPPQPVVLLRTVSVSLLFAGVCLIPQVQVVLVKLIHVLVGVVPRGWVQMLPDLRVREFFLVPV